MGAESLFGDLELWQSKLLEEFSFVNVTVKQSVNKSCLTVKGGNWVNFVIRLETNSD